MQNISGILSIEAVMGITGLGKDDIIDLIACGDLPALGSRKDLVRLCDLNILLGVYTAPENISRPVDLSGKQRYSPSHSILLIEDITESEWDNMKTKEHTPYFDNQKQRWCIALSLGKNEDGKRIRKVISGATQPELWDAYREYLGQQAEVAPVAADAPIVIFRSVQMTILAMPYWKRILWPA